MLKRSEGGEEQKEEEVDLYLLNQMRPGKYDLSDCHFLIDP
jgi:hypothetical protein